MVVGLAGSECGGDRESSSVLSFSGVYRVEGGAAPSASPAPNDTAPDLLYTEHLDTPAASLLTLQHLLDLCQLDDDIRQVGQLCAS